LSAQFYNENADALAQQYLSKSFEEVHQSWAHLLPSIIENPNARILDMLTECLLTIGRIITYRIYWQINN
jgi:hypothetical protein